MGWLKFLVQDGLLRRDSMNSLAANAAASIDAKSPTDSEHGADAVFVAGDAGTVEILKQRDGVFTGQSS